MAVVGVLILIALALSGFFKDFTGCTWLLVFTFLVIGFAVHPVAGGAMGLLGFIFATAASRTLRDGSGDQARGHIEQVREEDEWVDEALVDSPEPDNTTTVDESLLRNAQARKKAKRIEPGMSGQDVIKRIGKPWRTRSLNMLGNRVEYEYLDGRLTLTLRDDVVQLVTVKDLSF